MRTAVVALFLVTLSACSAAEEPPVSADQQAQLGELEQRLHGVCSAPSTYARLRELLFDEAARHSGGDVAVLDERAATASVSLVEPVTATGDPRGVVVCSGRLLVELPAAQDASRLAANVEYAAQAASDGSGLVFDLEGAGDMVRELAMLAGPAPAPAAPEPAAAPDPGAPVDGAHRAIHSTGPSFDCAFARLPSEKMICGSRPLADLDRQMASLYYDHMARADESKRQLLRRTRDAFLTRRDRCQQSGCIASVYEDRIAEIRRIGERG